MSHYIPAFTGSRKGHERAACGEWVKAGTGSNEPECKACQTFLTDEVDADASIEATFNDPDFATTSEPIRPDADVVAEYARRMRAER